MRVAYSFALMILSTRLLSGQTATPTLTTIYQFQGGSDGSDPQRGLVQNSDGVLYGTTYLGGKYNGGTLYELIPPGNGSLEWTKKTLWSFGASPEDGMNPESTLLLDSSGALYGTTVLGGKLGGGTVYKFVPPTLGQHAVETILYSFSTSDLFAPLEITFGPSGEIFGVCDAGVDQNTGGVFELFPPVNEGAPWTEADLYHFKDKSDGGVSTGALILDSAGNLYGTTYEGGIVGPDGYGQGVVFMLTPPLQAGGAWTESVLFRFSGEDGISPDFGLVMDASGNLYGTTFAGGPRDKGTVFRLSPPAVAGQSWIETVLHSFGESDGANPSTPLTFDAEGNLYGATADGGAACSCGALFQLIPSASSETGWRGGWNYVIPNATVGMFPVSNLLFKERNVLYGVTISGGLLSACGGYGCGTVYEIR